MWYVCHRDTCLTLDMDPLFTCAFVRLCIWHLRICAFVHLCICAFVHLCVHLCICAFVHLCICAFCTRHMHTQSPCTVVHILAQRLCTLKLLLSFLWLSICCRRHPIPCLCLGCSALPLLSRLLRLLLHQPRQSLHKMRAVDQTRNRLSQSMRRPHAKPDGVSWGSDAGRPCETATAEVCVVVAASHHVPENRHSESAVPCAQTGQRPRDLAARQVLEHIRTKHVVRRRVHTPVTRLCRQKSSGAATTTRTGR